MLGKKLADYINFQGWILILLVAVFLVRLGLSLSGASFSQIRWLSMNLVLVLGLIYCAVAVHTRKFGGIGNFSDCCSCRTFSRTR